MAYNLQHTQKTLERFRDYVIQQSRTNLTKGGKNVTSNLYSQLKGEVKAMPNSLGVYFEMPYYGLFQDKGVRGVGGTKKNGEAYEQRGGNSEFRFGSGKSKGGSMYASILKWVQARRFQFTTKNQKNKKDNGKLMSYKTTAAIITKSLWHTGIRPSLFFTTPFKAGYKKYITEDLIKGFALDVEDLMKTSLKDIKK
jgi:hypothetical protein